ncbi:hypothetical protein BVRB_7g170600 [Beta vulgaris subsp. vulgaris]|nr:hypothetical protein BVRB_7g170600 [Beta vulgaris subsp. vulgaris]
MKKTQYYLIDTSVVLAGAVVSELHKDPGGLDVQLSYDGLRVPVNL